MAEQVTIAAQVKRVAIGSKEAEDGTIIQVTTITLECVDQIDPDDVRQLVTMQKRGDCKVGLVPAQGKLNL